MHDDEPASACEAAPSAALSGRTTYLLLKLGEQVKVAARDTLAPLGLRPRHLDVLSTLATLPAPSQQMVSTALGIDPNSIVDVVDDLERLGYVVRERNARDRRQYLLVATPAGLDVLARASVVVDDAEEKLLAVLTPEQRAVLPAAAAALLAALREAADPVAGW